MKYIVFFLCFLLVNCNSNPKKDNNSEWSEKTTYVSLYNYLKTKDFIVESEKGINYQYNALSRCSHREIIDLLKQFESFPENDKSLVHSLKVAGLNLNRALEKDSFVKTQILNNEILGVNEMLFISNYLKLQPTNPYFIEAFRTITLNADKKFLRRFLENAGYMKFNRFTDEYTTYDLSKLSHLPKGLVDTLLMKVNSKSR